MKLDQYIAKKGWQKSYVAWKLGVSEISVARYMSGQRLPTYSVMRKIAALTNGHVTANDFYGIDRKSKVSGNA
jgi:hypothetical protein